MFGGRRHRGGQRDSRHLSGPDATGVQNAVGGYASPALATTRQRPLMVTGAGWTMPPLAGGLLLLALAVNVFVLPAAQVVPALFAVPALLAAGVWPPRRVAQVSAAAVACYLLGVYEASRPPAVWPLGLFALTVLGGLGTQLAVQRVRVREVSAAAVDGLARAEVA